MDNLITHGPLFGILDKTIRGKHVGCPDLREKVFRIKPKIHVFGHIHEGFGIIKKDNITFVNASLLNHKYYYTNDPVFLKFAKRQEKFLIT